MIILFYPEPLLPHSKVARILAKRPDVRWHNNPRKPHDIHIFWSYTPKKIKPDIVTKQSANVINRGCYNISKVKVNNVFNDISVDPLTHRGVCVEKIDRQGKHKHHRLITCPAQPRRKYIYQRFFENRDGEMFVSYRIHYADGIKIVEKRKKPAPFMSGETREILNIRDFFNPEQEKDLVRKCVEFGFNYGEIDFQMAGSTPVVIDINNIVGGTRKSDKINPALTEQSEKVFWNYMQWCLINARAYE